MTGTFTCDTTRYTLLHASGALTNSFASVSINYPTNQSFTPQITYDLCWEQCLSRSRVQLPVSLSGKKWVACKVWEGYQNRFQRESLGRRALTLFLVCSGSACLLGTGAPTTSGQAFSYTQAPERLRTTLTFGERVAYQYAIEEVYWRHRIWPKENRAPKPLLDAIVSRREIERKVEDYLRKSELGTDPRGSPIAASDLQAEMDRMASHSRRPDVLRELFQALGNDPFVIAECLARPILAERLVAKFNDAASQSFPAKSSDPVERPLSSSAGFLDSARNDILENATYKLPEIAPLDCADDTWTATATLNAPEAREFHTAVWTGSEMIVWGGFNSSPPYRLNTGGRYNPSTDSWASTSVLNAPTGRDLHSAVWTGTEMIIWGGEPILNTGGRYNPITDSWTATSTVNAPGARESHTAVWTGSEMVVWGGRNCCTWFNSGGRYNPSTNSWIATSTINAPEARWDHTAVWTGSEMIVWGGTDQTNYLNTGGRYNPATDSWTPTGLTNAPLGRIGYTAIWSGSRNGCLGRH